MTIERAWYLGLCLVIPAAMACVAEGAPDDDGGGFDDAAAEARNEARAEGGKSDRGGDLCLALGFYGDGICDDFCPAADPDCDHCPAFVTYHSCFTTDAWTCPEHSTPLIDPSGCGCGCVADPEVECPSGADPDIGYHSCFTTDAWTCPDGWAQVIDPDGCGCYCERVDEATCPSPEEAIYHSCFTADAWTCPEGWQQVIEPEGCGCYCEPG
jgi:hypothetical protein